MGSKLELRMSHFIKRGIQKLVISNYKSLHKADYVLRSVNEMQSVRICKNLILNEKSELRVDPITSERYIVNLPLNMYVFINENSIDIIKDNYPQNVPISPKSLKTILNVFDNHAHMDRVKYKNKVISNLKLTLESIEMETKNLKDIN